jgi:D-tagatose-1,6-bisphosphate aldolase subunit GatZ/KbaZ
MIVAENKILSVIKEHKSGKPVGITSVCSSNEYVIKAAILNAKKYNKILLVESTSNQVDQFGGYTGMTPKNFRDFVLGIAASLDFVPNNLILGGDHLGPNVWQKETSARAMENAKDQIAAYINAGYSKIHLDASMKCADDGNPDKPLEPRIIAERASLLCKIAEESYQITSKEIEQPVYVIGTDVPPPGGAKEESNSIRVTTPQEIEETINLTKQSFLKNGLEDAWNRVIAVVVQPGVEFGDKKIFNYRRSEVLKLKKKIETENNLVYEAHSTDYQLKESLRQMVEDHFAILKVGPWLTFAFREALFVLDLVERELLSNKKNVTLSDLTNVIETRMKQNPRYWEKYYKENDEDEIRFQRKYSLSDRIRYYWNDEVVNNSLTKLLNNLSVCDIPVTLISQFLPEAYEAVRNGEIKNTPDSLIINRISKVLSNYNYATMGDN